MNKKGTIFTYSIVYSASEAFSDKTPYVVAIIENGEGKFLSRIDDYKEEMNIVVGMDVELIDTDTDIPLCKIV
ncbi:MAG: hypothetical protein CVU87_06385 [Firmicutes bacterium HGW-Firmicutes-12]|jgi:uncharacterized OB-fold protein|nr:MAG: hypothetical protein CVU87_06385 [Firmicutes bacterium HGW-Firmicutes-12]